MKRRLASDWAAEERALGQGKRSGDGDGAEDEEATTGARERREDS